MINNDVVLYSIDILLKKQVYILLPSFLGGNIAERMIAESIILAVVAVSVTYLLMHYYGRPKAFPPGPYPLPIIGSLHLLGDQPHKVLQSLASKYGDVFSIFFGGWKVVIVNNIENAKEALIQKSADFAGRPHR